MNVENRSEPTTKPTTRVDRKSDRELVVTRTVDAPARIVFDAWTKPELFARWWVPRSCGMRLSTCEMDVRVGGSYRLVFEKDGKKVFEAFGVYTEVTAPTRIVWTDGEKGAAADQAFTAATFTEKDGKTEIVFVQLFPSKEALEEEIANMELGTIEQFEQLAEFVTTLR